MMMNMTKEQIEKLCLEKEHELIGRYFGNLVHEAAVERPETIDNYPPSMPIKIESEYVAFLETLWDECAPEELKGTPLVLEEQRLRSLSTARSRENVDLAYKEATTRTLWERITKTNHTDVTRYKWMLKYYAQALLSIARIDFMEEITGNVIATKAFSE